MKNECLMMANQHQAYLYHYRYELAINDGSSGDEEFMHPPGDNPAFRKKSGVTSLTCPGINTFLGTSVFRLIKKKKKTSFITMREKVQFLEYDISPP